MNLSTASNESTNCFEYRNGGIRLEYDDDGDGGEKESAEPEDDKWNIDDLTESEVNLSEETESEGGESEFDLYREVMENELDPYREVLEHISHWNQIPPGLQEHVINPRGSLVREMEALFSNVLIRKPEGTNPDGDSTKECESKPDDSEEDFNPERISSPVGIDKAVSDAGEDPDL